MKKLYFLFAFFSVGISFSQTILNQAETTSRTVEDPLEVRMIPGFTANSVVVNPFIAKISSSSNNDSNNPTDSNAGSGNPSGTIGSNNFHDTQGNIEVNGGGQLQFTLPIALPPGVKNVAPQINLVYTSGSGNGIAGYGWNINGITAITRMGKTIEQDGEVKAIQLDYTDYYSFNGQRLILKSGEYGKNGAEYTTEKYSNVKIKSVGAISGQAWQGPEYWEVTFEDGSQAWYGNTATGANNARTPIEYNIVKWKDNQGNYISYNYIQDTDTNVAIISSIQWGGNETLHKNHFNSISFNYKVRSLIETSFVMGQKFSQEKILDNITVFSNNILFKQYDIDYGKDLDISKYEYVKSIKELSSDGKEANPVEFYKPPISYIANKQNLNANLISENQVFGDFDGDGRVDLLYYNGGSSGYYECLEYDDYGNCENQGSYIEPSSGGTYVVFNRLDGNQTPVKVSNEDLSKGIAASGLLDKNGKLFTEQGIIIKREIQASNGNPKKLEFKTFILNKTEFVLLRQKEISATLYDLTGTYPPNPGMFQNYQTINTSVGEFKQLDVNGDGITEIVFSTDNIRLTTTYVYDGGPGLQIPREETYTENYFQNFILDLNSTDDVITRIPISKNIAKIDLLDMTGDGKTDFIDKSDNYMYLLTKDSSAGDFTYTLINFNGEVAGLQYGDFNGDGKLDFAVPEKGVEETTNWRLYINRGDNNFKEQYISNFLTYRKEPYVSTSGRKRQRIYTTLVKDLNNDGKDDFINVKSETFRKHDLGANRDSEFDIKIKINEGSDYSGNIIFRETYNDHIDSTIEDHFAPINISARISGIDRFIMIKHGNYSLFTYDYFNLPVNYTVNKISQGGLITNVTYNELDAGNYNTSNFYKSNDVATYPFVVLRNLISKAVVTQLKQDNRLQDFRYRDLTSHFQGRGIVGFRQTARSTWYTSDFENTKVWSGAEIDPENDGLPTKEWSIKTNDESQIFPSDISLTNTNLLSFKSTQYQTYNLVGGIKATVPIQSVIMDFKKKIKTESSVTYGDYYLPKQTVSNTNDGFAIATTDLEYIHNALGSGKDYYIGRPKSKTEQMQVYGDTKGSKEEYVYNANNLLETLKTWNRNNSGWLQETYTYDGFGNVTKKEITNSIDDNKKTDEASFDDKGRFVISKKDNLGLITTITYNNVGQILTQTDPLENILTNTYDGWGKILTSKHNLSGVTTYTYEKTSDAGTTVTQYSPDGGVSINYTNKIGQNYRVKTKGFTSGSYISKDMEYDAIGRKIRESEPYLDSDTPKWNTIEYDDYSRPIKTIAFTGKIIETTYDDNNRSATVTETNANGRFKKQAVDAIGNIISSQDLGGVITYKYNAAGENTEATYEGNVVKTSFDAWGNKVRFEDPSNGIYTYEYNGYFGMLSKSISPKGEKTYIYNGNGLLITQTEKSTDGSNATDKNISFTYNNKGALINKAGSSKGKSFSSYVNYDANGRVISSSENSNDRMYTQKDITYDDKGRVTSYEKSLLSSGVQTKVIIENVYDNWNGSLYQLKDKNLNKILWELQNANAKGQVLKAKLGATTIDNTYDANNFLSNILHKGTNSGNTVLSVSYSFNAIKNELNSRTTGGDFNILEQFKYDDNNRLVNWTDPVANTFNANDNRNVYDNKGRITYNDQLGNVKFEDATKLYRATGATLNSAGEQNYTNDLIQKISYNENNDPVFIDGEKGDVRFEYGLTNMRQRVTYGGNFDVDGNGKFTKYYSEDGSYEIVRNNQTGQEKHILYIGGTPYESNIVYLKDFTENVGSYKFLHKDYLGSILAITDEAGNKLEQRHFDAWGNLTHLKIGNGTVITDKDVILSLSKDLVIDRGYTSHEHLYEVGLIHMNGRLYDPVLRRFLNADENIQDMFNTQNYNKYGYVLNNPMMYWDPSGEFIWFVIAAAAIIGGYTTGVKANGSWNPFEWDWKKTGWKILGGAVVGAISGATGAWAGQAAAAFAASALGIQGGILGGAIAGLAGGAVGGAISGLGDAVVFGESVGRSIVRGFISGAIGGAIIGGAVGGIQQGIANAKPGAIKGNIWSGAKVAPGRSAWALNNTAKPTTVGKIPKLEVGQVISEGTIPNKPTDLFDRNPNLARELNMNADGSWNYPPNNGALGDEVNLTLKPGTYVDRFGTEGGQYVSPVGTDYGARSLPPGSFNKDYNLYQINSSINVKASIVSPYFGQPGLGTQYRFSEPIYKLIEKGILIRVP